MKTILYGTKHPYVPNDRYIMVEKETYKPYMCANNLEHAKREVKDYLYANHERWRNLMLLANLGFEKGLIVSTRSGLYVYDEFTSLALNCEPTKFKILGRIALKYGFRNLGVALGDIIHERGYFTSPEYLNEVLKGHIEPKMKAFITERRK